MFVCLNASEYMILKKSITVIAFDALMSIIMMDISASNAIAVSIVSNLLVNCYRHRRVNELDLIL